MEADHRRAAWEGAGAISQPTGNPCAAPWLDQPWAAVSGDAHDAEVRVLRARYAIRGDGTRPADAVRAYIANYDRNDVSIRYSLASGAPSGIIDTGREEGMLFHGDHASWRP